jgi:hypothetical protein
MAARAAMATPTNIRFFDAGFGIDIIYDFEHGTDKLLLGAYANSGNIMIDNIGGDAVVGAWAPTRSS